MDTPRIDRFATSPPVDLAHRKADRAERGPQSRPTDPHASSGPESAPQNRGVAHEQGLDSRSSATRPGPTEDRERSALVREAADELQTELDTLGAHSLRITYEEDAERFVVSVVDSETQEVIRQIPPEALLEARRQLEELRGLLFDDHS